MSAASPVIEIDGLRKEYRGFRGPATVAVDGLDLSVPVAVEASQLTEPRGDNSWVIVDFGPSSGDLVLQTIPVG